MNRPMAPADPLGREERGRSFAQPPGAEGLDLALLARAVVTGLRRRLWVIVLCTVFMGVLAALAVVLATPRYAATASVFIDPRGSGEGNLTPAFLSSDALIVDSEVEVMRSEAVARRVVLARGAPESGTPEPPSLVTRAVDQMRGILGLPSVMMESGRLPPEEAAVRREIAALLNRVDVERRGDSYVVDITVRGTDPLEVAETANLFVEQYLLAVLDAEADALLRVGGWLEGMIAEATERVRASERRVAEFRLEHGIIGQAGQQVVEQELLETNEALVATRQGRIARELQLEEMGALLAGERDLMTGVTIEGNLSIPGIRDQIANLESELRALTMARGPRAPGAAAAEARIEALREQLREEYRRAADRSRTERDMSLREEEQLRARVDELNRAVTAVAEHEADLSNLEVRAAADRRMLETLVARINETEQARAVQSTDARVIGAALPPAGPFAPRRAVIIALGIVSGLLLGAALAFLLEQIDDELRRPSEIEGLGIGFRGPLPRVAPRVDGHLVRLAERPSALSRTRRQRLSMLTLAADRPMSQFGETVRDLALRAETAARATAADPAGAGPRGLLLGFVSLSPGDGKTTLAANTAFVLAQRGHRVALIDGDLRRRSLSGDLAALGRPGSLAALFGAPEETVAATGHVTEGLTFFGTGDRREADALAHSVAVEAVQAGFAALRRSHDFVVVDLAPLGRIVETRVMAAAMDRIVLALRWGSLPARRVAAAMRHEPEIGRRIEDAVLTMTPSDFHRYDDIGAQYDAYFRE